MNIYAKLAKARTEFHAMKLTKTGHNKFAGYKYFELGDFLVPGMKCLSDNGLVPIVSFTDEFAVMEIREIEGEGIITISSPMSTANLKGCHPIQNLGAVETYQRRYLWVSALEIVEHDAVDSSAPVEDAPIDEGQLSDLISLMDELGERLDRDKFKGWLKTKGVDDFAKIRASLFSEVVAMLEMKRVA